jgi:sigma-B regulation protein RsbU (phosphoserine phosphatase)
LTVPILYKNKLNGIFMLIDKEGRDGKDSFNEGDKKLLAAFANQAAIAIENSRLYLVSLEKERMQRDIELAAEIQRELIPDRFPEYRGLDINGFCIPCRTVGGDYYHYFNISDDKLLLVVADVSGKGIPAALLVSSLNSVLIVEMELETDLKKIVGALSRSIFQSSTSGKYATAFFAEIDLRNSTIRYINAGHNPPLFLAKNGKRLELMEGGFCIGMFEDGKYKAGEIPFRKGELISIYTDGITEQTNEKDEFFEEERLFDIIISSKNKPAEAINNKVIDEVHSFRKNTPIADDMTLLTIKRL